MTDTYNKLLRVIRKNNSSFELSYSKRMSQAASACEQILEQEKVKGQIEVLEEMLNDYAWETFDRTKMNKKIDSLQQLLNKKP